MSKLEERIARVVLGSPIYNPKKISHNAISELAITLKDLFKQWALELLPEKEEHIVVITTDGKEGRSVKDWIKKGKNEVIDEIRERIEKEAV